MAHLSRELGLDRLYFLKLASLLRILLLLLLFSFSSYSHYVFSLSTRVSQEVLYPRPPPFFFSVTRRGYTAYFSHRPFVPSFSLRSVLESERN